jgi:tripartite-type tricarboxylate transporter receptor subunit TctC
MGRLIADRMGSLLGQPVVVDNRAGAGGTIGAAYAAKAQADGYTLLMGSMGQAVQPLLYKKLSFNGNKAFTPVATFATVPNVLAISTNTPAKNLSEFVAYAKAHPGGLNMASAGIGSINHLTGEMFESCEHQVDPYSLQGASPATTDLQAGQVNVLFANLPNVLPFAKSGKVRLLGIASDKRAAAIPEVPTFAEGGVKDVVVESWYGIMAPAGTSPAIVKKLQDTILTIAHEKDFVAHLAEQGAYPYPNSAADFAKLMDMEVRRWTGIIQSAKISMD